MAILGEILKAWRSHNVIKQLFESFGRMLALCYEEYTIALDVWAGRRSGDEVGEQLRAADKQVNQLQRDIRGKLVQHLTLNPGDSVPASLVFMSVIKDAERLGDYSENIAEVCRYITTTSEPAIYAVPLNELMEKCRVDFERTRRAFAADDAKLAADTILTTKEVRVRCDQLLDQLLQETGSMPPRRAVAFALATRYVKRVSAHLKNICTAVVAPVEFLDYSKKGIAARSEQ
jgi:phosphate transport system protein